MVDAKAYTEITKLVMSQAMTLDERLACILSQAKNLVGNIEVEDVHGFNGMSGYNYWLEDQLIAQLHFGSLASGTYVLLKKITLPGKEEVSYDYYDAQGNFFYQSPTLDGETIKYQSIAMDPSSPFINHLYNILFVEYESASTNFGNTARILLFEKLLKDFYNHRDIHISVQAGRSDQAIKNINNEILKIENDPVLTWTERQNIFKQLRSIRNKVLRTKRRVHKLKFTSFDLAIMTAGFTLKFITFRKRPIDNLRGLFKRHTLGHVQWFFRTVKQNLGLSVAMAIYGPFTFYFITQPMNPHAMWAVGKVRNAYIDTVEDLFGSKKPESPYVDKISTVVAAPKKTNSQSSALWEKRMDRFKAMQISYEESMVFAARIGRIEQFETQFNFPLTAEAAWMEMELYLNDIELQLAKTSKLDKDFVNFLKKEKHRTLELQIYIWHKVGQFFLDHPYIVVDQNNEQTERNYYVGRQFVFFNTMTDKLSRLNNQKQPETHRLIQSLAKKFKTARLEGNSVLDTLKKNSKLFRQKDIFNSDEQRQYMARQWEVLFLQQNKKQEAASFALQTYTWSVKNAIWILQTFHSAKRSELSLLASKFQIDHKKGSQINPLSGMNEYLENMYHNLTMEYVSIKKEMLNELGKDKEATMRESVIDNLKEYLLERDKLFNHGVYAKMIEKGVQQL